MDYSLKSERFYKFTSGIPYSNEYVLSIGLPSTYKGNSIISPSDMDSLLDEVIHSPNVIADRVYNVQFTTDGYIDALEWVEHMLHECKGEDEEAVAYMEETLRINKLDEEMLMLMEDRGYDEPDTETTWMPSNFVFSISKTGKVRCKTFVSIRGGSLIDPHPVVAVEGFPSKLLTQNAININTSFRGFHLPPATDTIHQLRKDCYIEGQDPSLPVIILNKGTDVKVLPITHSIETVSSGIVIININGIDTIVPVSSLRIIATKYLTTGEPIEYQDNKEALRIIHNRLDTNDRQAYSVEDVIFE